MVNFNKKFNPFTGKLQFVLDANSINGLTFQSGVANEASLPSSGNETNDARITNDNHHLFIWNGTSWVDQGDIFDLNWGVIGGNIADQTDLQSALDAKADQTSLDTHEADTTNPHAVSAEQVNVENASEIKLLLHANGEDASTTFVDSSPSAHTITANSNAQIDDAQSKFGGTSFRNFSPGWLVVDNPTDFNFGTNDFTIDFWLRFSGFDISNAVFTSHDPNQSPAGYNLIIASNDKLQFSTYSGVTPTNVVTTADNSIEINTWYHVAIVRNNDSVQIYINGQPSGSPVDYTGVSVNIGNAFHIGKFYTHQNSFYFKGWLDEFRVVNGSASWTKAFKPPIREYAVKVQDHIDADYRLDAQDVKTTDASDVQTKLDSQDSEITKALASGLQFFIDGGGSEISTGIAGWVEVPFDCTITEARLLADQSGSIVVDIWKDTYANYPPTDADSITASAVPTISGATKSEDATLTGWTTSVSKGDILYFSVDSVTTIQKCLVSLTVNKV